MIAARFALTLGSLTTLACGPPSAGFDSTSDASETSGSQESSESEDGSSTSTESSSSNATFIPDPDHPSEPVSCDPFMQDCPEGEKCVPYASDGGNWNANKCVPVNGDQAPGEPCIYAGKREGTDDCDASSLCWNVTEVEGELVGECLPFCLGRPDRPQCPEESFCPISGDGSINVCIPRCDPLVQDCDEGRGCYWGGSAFICAVTIDDIPVGEPCGFINDCVPGLVCVTAEVVPNCAGSACCSAFCNTSLGDEQCAVLPGTTCSGFFEEGMEPPGYETVGVCILP